MIVFANATIDSFTDLIARGGWVMYPLLALSVIGLTLSFERIWFWLRTNNTVVVARVGRMSELLRRGDLHGAKVLADRHGSVYDRIVKALLSEEPTEAAAIAAIEDQRPRMERFMSSLSTIITAAPMLGILGTVLGLIGSFNILADSNVDDPRQISPEIAKALITTAVGLVIAIVVLFPYNGFRAQADRTLGRIETLTAAIVDHDDAPAPSKDSESKSE